jgi:ribose transport system permease protein
MSNPTLPAALGGATPVSTRSRVGAIVGSILRVREITMVVLILAMGTAMSFLSPHFLDSANFVAMARGFSMEGFVVVGMATLLIAGAFDLSVGSIMALSGVIAARLISVAQVPYIVAVLGGLGVGFLSGTISGLVVTRIKVNPLIATLGMMSVARGIALGITEGRSVINIPPDFAVLGQGNLFGVPLIIVYMVVIVIIADILLRRGRAFRQLYYVGSSEKAARLSGINVDRLVLLAYIGCGVITALAGVISMARLTSGIPTAFAGVELRIIAACVIGGCSLSGGEGTILGAILGLVFMALVTNALTLFGVSIYWEGVVTGTILTAAVSLDMLSRRRLKTQ